MSVQKENSTALDPYVEKGFRTLREKTEEFIMEQEA